MLYKLWSGFTKNLRHLLIGKFDTVRLAKIGVFTAIKNIETGLVQFDFTPSSELAQALGSST